MSSFRRLDEREIYQGFVIRVTNEIVREPDRRRSSTATSCTRCRAVAVVPVLPTNEVVCVRQYRPALQHDLLEIPAGMCDVEGEALVETAQRELGEEAGYRAGRIEQLCAYHDSPGSPMRGSTSSSASTSRRSRPHSQSEEEHHMTVELVALEDTLELVASKAIVDAKTIIGLLLARERLGHPVSAHRAVADIRRCRSTRRSSCRG